MKRKLIKQGGYGLTFYVPKKWIDAKHLNAGDEIEVTEEEDKLILEVGKAKKEIRKVEITVGAENFNTYRSLIGGLYRSGYDEIHVHFSDKESVSELQKTADALYGFEIFEIDC